MRKFKKIITLATVKLITLTISQMALATEPLHNELSFEGKKGIIFPKKCCWLELPENAKVKEIGRREEGCSAVGGPVGVFSIQDRKIWLTGLSGCTGNFELSKVYTGATEKIHAKWLDGQFTGVVGYLCDKDNQAIYEREIIFKITEGMIEKYSEKQSTKKVCTADE